VVTGSAGPECAAEAAFCSFGMNPHGVYSTGISLLIMPRSIPCRLRMIRAPT
jgi:hypothetical protein